MDINIKQISWNLEASRLSISVNEQRLWVNKETLFFRRLHHCLHSQKRTFILWRLTLPWLQPPEPEWLRFHDFLCGKSPSLILVSAPVPTISLNRIKSARWSLCGPPVTADNYSKRCLGCSWAACVVRLGWKCQRQRRRCLGKGASATAIKYSSKNKWSHFPSDLGRNKL